MSEPRCDRMPDNRSPRDVALASAPPNAQLTHLGIFVRDLPAMVAFYTRVLGLVVTDTGVLRGRELAFLSRNAAEHHQIVLAAGRSDDGAEVINQISFRVDDLAGLRRFNVLLLEQGVADQQAVTHGNAWSIYFRDPESNRIELYTDSDWYVRQPMRVPIDLTADEASIRATTRALLDNDPTLKPIEDWSAELDARLHRPEP